MAAELGKRPTTLIREWIEDRLRRSYRGEQSTLFAVGADTRERRPLDVQDLSFVLSTAAVEMVDQYVPFVVLRVQTIPGAVVANSDAPPQGEEHNETLMLTMEASVARDAALELLRGAKRWEERTIRERTGREPETATMPAPSGVEHENEQWVPVHSK